MFRYPDLSAKIGRLMDDYVLALRSKDETPGLLLAMTREAEAAILDKYQADVASKQQGIYDELYKFAQIIKKFVQMNVLYFILYRKGTSEAARAGA